MNQIHEGQMPPQQIHIVLRFEKKGRKLVAGTALTVKSADEAIRRAESAAANCAGVVAMTQTIDNETGEHLDETIILARHGTVPHELSDGTD